MGLLDNYMGIGMCPRPKDLHQDYMAHILHFAYDEILEQGLVIRTESTMTTDWDDLAPDIVVFDRNRKPLLILEITTRRERSSILNKCEELLTRFPESEYFVFDYESNLLYKYDAEDGSWIYYNSNELFSNYLSQPMSYYIDL